MSNTLQTDGRALKNHDLGLSDEQRSIVIESLSEILADSSFKHSQRSSLLLREVVERALAGNSRGFKERTLGAEVFGRDPDYDTNTDPVVRITASDIRKRLAMFYQQSDHQLSIRIRLVPGSYQPEFDFLATETAAEANQFPDAQLPTHEGNSSSLPADSGNNEKTTLTAKRYWVVAGISAVFLLSMTGIALSSLDLFRSTQYLFWKPLLSSELAPIISISDDDGLQMSADEIISHNLSDLMAQSQAVIEQTMNENSTNAQAISLFGDANAAHKVALWLAQHDRSTTLRPSSELTMWFFKGTPTVLIGYLNNPWSLTLLSELRFTAGVDAKSQMIWIQDRQNPNKREWIQTQPNQESSNVEYAVISRFHNSDTGHWMIAIAGLGVGGTEAASQLLTDPLYEGLLPNEMRSSENFQLVISANKISGKLGVPSVLAFHTW